MIFFCAVKIRWQKNSQKNRLLLVMFIIPIMREGFYHEIFYPLENAAIFLVSKLSGSWYLLPSFYFFFYWFSLFETYDVLCFYFQSFLLLYCSRYLGTYPHGAKSWFSFVVCFSAVDTMKLILFWFGEVFFSRHVDWDVKHIFISGFMLLYPWFCSASARFGSAMIILFIGWEWCLSPEFPNFICFLVIVTGVVISRRFGFLFLRRIRKPVFIFINPWRHYKTGYNVFQSTIAVGSGQFTGKGLGFGTQSRLNSNCAQSDFILPLMLKNGVRRLCVILILYVW